ncbi:hypothetical protein LCGC14_0365460 [marine sediment metagenome]|uniref:Uncharacterized protein n=1 Tax=marine sediment metagenome TaxID=412755 RepID=A0A0F9T6Q3_9ZZZZ
MASLRLEISYSIPESETGIRLLSTTIDEKEVGGIVLPAIVANKIKVVLADLHDLKKYAQKINEGQPNEENTTRAIYRICYHDEGEGHKPDSPEMEI